MLLDTFRWCDGTNGPDLGGEAVKKNSAKEINGSCEALMDECRNVSWRFSSYSSKKKQENKHLLMLGF